MNKLNKPLLAQAFRETCAAAVLDDEVTGARYMKAANKALTEIECNDSIDFDGKTLGFTSRFSNETRFVTENGCAPSYCRCGGQISYHTLLYAILVRYTELSIEQELNTVFEKEAGVEVSYLPNTVVNANRLRLGKYFID